MSKLKFIQSAYLAPLNKITHSNDVIEIEDEKYVEQLIVNKIAVKVEDEVSEKVLPKKTKKVE